MFSFPSLDPVTTSVGIVGLVTFVGDAARGILFPALWPLCQELGGTEVDLGYLVAIFSVGRLVISTRLGIISDKYRHRAALLLSGVILIIGAALWSNTSNLGGLPMLYISQFLLGLGTGSLGVTRSYVVELSSPSTRTYRLARLSSFQYAGFAATPLTGSALVVTGALISKYWEYSLPSYLVLGLAIVCFILLLFCFQDIPDANNAVSTTQPIQTNNIQSDHKNIFNPIANVSTFPSHGKDQLIYQRLDQNDKMDDEESGTKISMVNDNVKKVNSFDRIENITVINPLIPSSETANNSRPDEEVGHDNKILDTPISTSESSMRNAAAELSNVYILMILMNFTTRGAIAVFETQGSRILLDTYGLNSLQLGSIVTISGVVGTIQLIFFKQFWTKNFSDMTLMLGGLLLIGAAQALIIDFGPTADQRQQLWRFVLALFLVYAWGYPIGNSAVLGTFSTLQKAGRQAKAQGQFAFMGSLARVVMPVLCGYMERYVDQTSSFALNLMLMSISLIGISFCYNRIVYFTVVSNLVGNNRTYSQTVKKTYGVWNTIYNFNSTQITVVALSIAAFVASFGAMIDWAKEENPDELTQAAEVFLDSALHLVINDSSVINSSKMTDNIWGVLTRKGGKQERFELQYREMGGKRDTYSIGRNSLDCDVVINDIRVSSLHCLVYCDYDASRLKIFIEDCSVNGTYINHSLHRIGKGSRMELKSGDEIFLIHPDIIDEQRNLAAFTFVNMRERFADQRAIVAAPKKSLRSNKDNANLPFSSEIISKRQIEDDYIIGDQLGAGMCGQVHYCIHRTTKLSYAVKLIDTRKFSLSPGLSIEDLKMEAELMKQLNHPNIIKIIDSYQSHHAIYIVMELVKGGDLFDRIMERRKYSEDEARKVIQQILSAVEYLHGNHIVHRDLKPENILLVDPLDHTHIKITDFGLAKKANKEGLKTFCGTPQYFAPEVLKRKNSLRGLGRYGFAADMWSVGVILYILLSGTFPFDEDQLYQQIESGQYSLSGLEWKEITFSAKHFIRCLMMVHPDDRITVKKALIHPWITNTPLTEDWLSSMEERSHKNRNQPVTTKVKQTNDHSNGVIMNMIQLDDPFVNPSGHLDVYSIGSLVPTDAKDVVGDSLLSQVIGKSTKESKMEITDSSHLTTRTKNPTIEKKTGSKLGSMVKKNSSHRQKDQSVFRKSSQSINKPVMKQSKPQVGTFPMISWMPLSGVSSNATRPHITTIELFMNKKKDKPMTPMRGTPPVSSSIELKNGTMDHPIYLMDEMNQVESSSLEWMETVRPPVPGPSVGKEDGCRATPPSQLKVKFELNGGQNEVEDVGTDDKVIRKSPPGILKPKSKYEWISSMINDQLVSPMERLLGKADDLMDENLASGRSVSPGVSGGSLYHPQEEVKTTPKPLTATGFNDTIKVDKKRSKKASVHVSTKRKKADNLIPNRQLSLYDSWKKLPNDQHLVVNEKENNTIFASVDTICSNTDDAHSNNDQSKVKKLRQPMNSITGLFQKKKK